MIIGCCIFFYFIVDGDGFNILFYRIKMGIIYIYLNFKLFRVLSVYYVLVIIKVRLDYEGYINVFCS